MPRRTVARAAAVARAATVAAALLGAGVALAQPAEGYRWRPADVVDGCEVSTSDVPGKPYVAARAVCVVPAAIDVVGAVLEDVERYPEWMQDCAQTKLLKVVDRERYVYVFWFRQHITLFSDRDMVLRSEGVVREARRRVVRASSTSEPAHDPGRGYVRMPSFFSEWELEALDDGRTRVSFTVDPDLGGGLPVGIANSTIRDTPVRSLRGLVRMTRLARYAERVRPAAEGVRTGAP